MQKFNTVNEQEKFGSLASRWWDKNGPVKTLHDINPVRLKYIQEKMNLQNSRVADIGCGGGILSESLAKAGASVIGIDTSDELIQVATHHAEKTDLEIEYKSCDAAFLSDQYERKFDAVICMELVEHVDDVYTLISDCAKLLKTNGLLFISTLNRTIWSYFLGIVAAEDFLKIVPKGTHDYNKFLKPSELATCCRSMKLENIDIKGLNYNPFTRIASLSKSININYICSFSAH